MKGKGGKDQKRTTSKGRKIKRTRNRGPGHQRELNTVALMNELRAPVVTHAETCYPLAGQALAARTP